MVDEQLTLRETWAPIWRANTPGPALSWPEVLGRVFHLPRTDAMRRTLGPFRAVTGLGYNAVPPRALNELLDQGIEALIDLIMLIEQIASFSFPRQQGRCHPSGSSSPSCACGAGFVASRQRCGPRTRAVSSVASGSKQPGVNGPQRMGTRWLLSSVICSKLSITWRTRS